MRKQFGFSLMELMIVILIIGILASVGIPSYQRYIEKSRFSEVITAAQPYKLAIALALQEGELLADINTGTNGIPAFDLSSKNVSDITVYQGVITATATKAGGGYSYVLTPDQYGSSWTVSGTCLAAGVCKP